MNAPTFKPGLESLRGIAALAVAVAHGLCTFPDATNARVMLEWMLKPFSPQTAVVIFFVLSGYVLGQSFRAKPEYLPFLVRRFFRIVPLFVLSVAFAFAVRSAFQIDDPSAITTAFYQAVAWPKPALANVWLNLTFQDTRVNGPTWSIWPELQGSALIPILVWAHLAAKRRFEWLLFGAITVALAFSPLRMILYFYWGFFFSSRVAAALDGKPTPGLITLLAGGAILVWFGADPINFKMITIAPSGLGAALLIAAIASTRYTFLETSPLRFLGRVSYSLYLLHWPIFLAVSSAFLQIEALPRGFVGNLLICILALFATLPLATLSYRTIELPCIALGRAALRAFKSPAAVPAE